ncbi:YceI family protein [Curtobacterium sp. Leaf261]|uniref:YceI family protein n=1 Tax=Curtobacterium sp. Leaf261 TaxID=1736311 RepID=UPI0006FE4EF0|nr:YceI family protein [Curtobacterium sp. Leaf261]KQO64643.1 polyisoprenoid-binding protein [Curtobacterium sp. Leaf261]
MERRRKRTLWITVAAVVVVVGGTAAIAGPAIYRNSIAGEADAAPSIAATREASTLDAAQLSGDWTVGSGSYAGYRVDEVLNGSPVTVTGRTKKVTGTATVEGSDITAATITVDVASIATDSGNRDAYFRDSAMDAQAFPTATFTTTESIADAVPSSDSATTKQEVTGKLTLHGVTKTVTATITSGLSGDGADVTGSIPITFADYGVTAPSLGFVKVEKTGSVEFLVHATPKS